MKDNPVYAIAVVLGTATLSYSVFGAQRPGSGPIVSPAKSAIEAPSYASRTADNYLTVGWAGTINNYQGSLSPEEREENRKLIRRATEYLSRP